MKIEMLRFILPVPLQNIETSELICQSFTGNGQHQTPNIYKLSLLLLNGQCLLKGKSGCSKGQNKLCLVMIPLG